MSGGVDSSVAAALLKKEGYDVIGIFMKYWSDPKIADTVKASNKCCSVEAFEDGRRVSDVVGIPIYTLNFSEPFKEKIVDNFISEYKEGRTPNPCVRCNEFIKFGLFWERAQELGCEYIATGHYARVEHTADGAHLFQPADAQKDQTYFLYRLKPEVLNHVLFPLAGYTKDETRKMAEEMGIPTFNKQDSQEICFVGDKKHYNFLSRHLEKEPGDIILENGNVVGTHDGIAFYTRGQRYGLHISVSGGPFYVIGFDTEKNQVIVSDQRDHPNLYSDTMFLTDLTWTQETPPKLPATMTMKIRYRHTPMEGELTQVEDNLYKVQLKEKNARYYTGTISSIF